MKIEICDNTLWVLLCIIVVIGIVAIIAVGCYYSNQNNKNAFVNGYSQVSDRTTSTHWEKK